MINVFGLASGFDANALIDAILQGKRVPIVRLEERKGGIETQISKLGELKSALSDLSKALDDLDSLGEVLALRGASTNEDVLVASADGTASPGSYVVDVQQLAGAEKNRGVAFASPQAEVTAGTLSIAVDGAAAVDVPIDVGDTLADVAEKINTSGAGVSASLVYDGTSYYLQVVAQETGFSTASADDAIVLTETYTGTGGQALGLAQITQAKNALLTVDQLPVEVRSNTLSNVLEGVTLELYQTGATTVDVTRDVEGTKENVQAFVDAYNAVVELVRRETNVTEDTDRARSLAAEPSVQRLRRDLATLVGGDVAGLSGAFTALSRIGVTTDGTGKLTIDDGELSDAIATDINAVGRIFTHPDTGLADALRALADSYTDSVDGFLVSREKQLGDRVRAIDDRVRALEDRLESVNDRLVRQFTAMEQAVSAFQSQGGALQSLFFPSTTA